MKFDWGHIGIIFTIMLTPFVILSFPLGKLSDKFFISAFFTMLIPFIVEPKLWIWALVLFATRVGAAIIEIMSESYFFKSVTEENADIISFFRNTGPLSYIIAPLIALPIFMVIPSFKYLFFVLGGVLLYGLFVTLRLKDVK
jgi:MFS family permease